MKYLLTIIALAVLAISPSQAYENLEWQSVGQAELKVLIWPVYQAKLETLDGTYKDNQIPAKLELTYLRDFSADALIKRTESEWKKLGVSVDKASSWLPELETIWTDIKKGDRLAVVVDFQAYSYFFKNDEYIGIIEDPFFSQAFLDIWLSPLTSQPENRKLLIGQ